MKRPQGARWFALGLTAAATVILLLNARHYFPFLSDDALISLRYARRLLDGHGLTWTDGQPVEGYSNLLWVLVVAAPGLVGVDLITAARGLGFLGMTTILATLAFCYGTRYPLGTAWFPIVCGLLSLSLAAPIAVWAIGGLEQPLVGALLAISISILFDVLASVEPRRGLVALLSFGLGLLCLTRPDGPLFAVAASGSLLVVRRSMALSMRVLVFPVLFYTTQLIFRLAYYGEVVPNTALVKIAPTTARWIFGWEYVTVGLSSLAPYSYLSVGAIAALIASSRTHAKGVVLAALAAVWSLYLVFIGGDIFPAYRHFVPLIVIGAFALAEGALVIAERLADRPRYLSVIALVTIALFVPYAQRQAADKHSVRAVRERWEWQGKEVALLLKRAFHRQQPLLAVTAAGSLPYWSELPSLDMLGLNDYYLPRHPPADMGTGFLGHELGDAQYVLGRNPDLIVFTVGSPPEFRAGQQLAATVEFNERYVPVTVRTRPSDFLAIIYFNKYSDKRGMGLMRADSTVTVPGFLLTAEGVAAHLNARDQLVATITSDLALQVTFNMDAALADSSIDVRASNPSAIISEVEQHGRTVTITLRTTSTRPVEIEEVVLRTQ